MPTLDSFQPPLFLKNAYVQTVLASSKLRTLGPNAMRAVARKEIIETAAGVKLLGYHSVQNNRQAKGLVILLHGWEGSVDSTYLLRCGRSLYRHGYDIFRLNFRDHGDSHHLNCGIFYAVLLEEVYQAVRQAAEFARGAPVFMIGFSLGGNFVLESGRVNHANRPDRFYSKIFLNQMAPLFSQKTGIVSGSVQF
jgi:predicted alpha/beta-fold hydrolase